MASFAEPRRERRVGMSQANQIALIHDDLDHNDAKWDRMERRINTMLTLAWTSFASLSVGAILLAFNLAYMVSRSAEVASK